MRGTMTCWAPSWTCPERLASPPLSHRHRLCQPPAPLPPLQHLLSSHQLLQFVPGNGSSALPRMDPTHPGEEATVATQRCPSYKCKKCAIHARVNVYVGRAYPSLQGKHVWYYPHPSELGLESRFGWSCGSSAIEIWTNCSAPEIITGPLPTCLTKYFMKADVIHYSPHES